MALVTQPRVVRDQDGNRTVEFYQINVPDEDVAAEANRQTLEQQAGTALTTNATFLAIANPSTAQNAAQIKAVTRQASGVIRLLLRRLEAV